jgi:uncharacterized MAPEG superfamily protein
MKNNEKKSERVRGVGGEGIWSNNKRPREMMIDCSGTRAIRSSSNFQQNFSPTFSVFVPSVAAAAGAFPRLAEWTAGPVLWYGYVYKNLQRKKLN